jgi:hypothetical protein
MKLSLIFLILFINVFSFAEDICECPAGLIAVKQKTVTSWTSSSSTIEESLICNDSYGTVEFNLENVGPRYYQTKQYSHKEDNIYDVILIGYECVKPNDLICDDNAPMLEIAENEYTCDRSCNDVNYGTGLDGKCFNPEICENAFNSCSDSCNGYVDNFSCTDGIITQPCSCQNKCTDFLSECVEECASQGKIVDNFACTNNQITNSCECKSEITIIDEDDENNSDDDTTDDENSTIDDSETTDDNNTNNNTNDNSNNDSDNGYSPAPDAGTGTGGNSLSDDMNSLGSKIDNNTIAVNENTSILEDINNTLSSIGDFLNAIDELINNPSSIGDTINQYLSDSANRYNENIFNEQCQAIQTIKINLYGKEITFLSQNLIDNYFPIELMRKFVIFIFAFSAVMIFFRGNN